MKFKVLNIENKSECEVILHGRGVYNSVTITSLIVKNVISPVYFYPNNKGSSEENFQLLIKRLQEVYKDKLKNVNIVRRKNIFNEEYPMEVTVLKACFTAKVKIDESFIEFCPLIVSEFKNPVENIIISKKLMAPCIVDVKEITMFRNKHEVNYTNIEFDGKASLDDLKIVAISAVIRNEKIIGFSFYDKEKTVVDGLRNFNEEGIYDLKNETDVFQRFNSLLNQMNPNVVILHNFNIKRYTIKPLLICDLYQFAMGTIKGRTYSIEELCNYYNIDYKHDFKMSSEMLMKIFYKMNALGLAKEMVEISGYLINKCFGNSRADKIEFTLMHELYNNDYLFPLKSCSNDSVSYTGGLVLSPERGFYQNYVVLLDFNSLYPSIIKEFNVCYSTIKKLINNFGDENVTEENQFKKVDYSLNLKEEEILFLPKIVKKFVEKRKEVKRLIKESDDQELLKILNTRQQVLKLTANSIYGCLGFADSRFCNYDMAAFITARGRELLINSKNIASGLGIKVIYGDTDSIMILSKFESKKEHYQLVLDSVNKLKDAVNALYENIEIEVECLFSKMLLFAKKRYAGLIYDGGDNYRKEYKGLDLVRRDYCKASSMLSNNVLDIIFNYNSASDTNLPQLVYDYCIKYYNNLENLSKNDYVISSILNKPIEMYDKDSQYPHVNMAIRLRKLGFNYQQNDVVNYVIGAGSGPVSRRGYLVNEDFEVDYDYYIKTQLIPPLYRIVDLIKSIRVDKISAIFGISTINIPKEVSKIKFVLDCCGSYEVPTDKCSKCDKEVSEEFYKIAVQRLLHQKVNYKDHYGECLVCNIKYSNMATSCLKCEKNLFFNFKNKEFDTLLSNIQNTFYENKIINEICDFYSEKSSYRVINLGDYFSNEFKRK